MSSDLEPGGLASMMGAIPSGLCKTTSGIEEILEDSGATGSIWDSGFPYCREASWVEA